MKNDRRWLVRKDKCCGFSAAIEFPNRLFVLANYFFLLPLDLLCVLILDPLSIAHCLVIPVRGTLNGSPWRLCLDLGIEGRIDGRSQQEVTQEMAKHAIWLVDEKHRAFR